MPVGNWRKQKQKHLQKSLWIQAAQASHKYALPTNIPAEYALLKL